VLYETFAGRGVSTSHVIGIGTKDGLGLVVDIDLATCGFGTLLSGDGMATFDVPTTTPDRARAVGLDGNNLIIGGSSGDDAFLAKLDIGTGMQVGPFGGTGGVVRPNPSPGADDVRGLTITVGSIFAVGGANDGANGAENSWVAKFDPVTGMQQVGVVYDLGGTQERLRVILPLAGDLFAAGVSSDDDSRGATIVRLNTTDLSPDTGCDPDGPGGNPGTGKAFFDFSDQKSNLFAMATGGNFLFPVGDIFNGSELDDVLQLKVGPDCVMDPTFAGGTAGNRIRFFFDPPPFGVIQPPGGPQPPGGEKPTPPGTQAGAPEPAFQSLSARSFITKARPAANGVISGIELTCPAFGAAGQGDRCVFDVTIDSTSVSARAQQAAKKKKKKRSVRLASGRITVPEGSKRAARLRLTRKGKRALRRSRARRVAAKLTVKVRNSAGQRRTFTRNVKVKLKKRRR
jgi:hypothetical protein